MGKRLEELTVKELKEKCRDKGIPCSGLKKDLISRLKKGSNIPDNIVNKTLYTQIRNKIKNRVTVWPSAYASGQVTLEYKKAGGKYSNANVKSNNLDRWYKEKWVNVCEKGHPACGRKVSNLKNYPYCRPSVRVNKNTPKTVSEISKSKLKEMCKKKQKSPLKRIKLN